MNSQCAISDISDLIAHSTNLGTDNALVEIGRLIGSDALLVVLETLGGPYGMQVYIPTPNNFAASLRRALRDRIICTRYNGTHDSISAFSAEFNISETRVRQILAKQSSKEVK